MIPPALRPGRTGGEGAADRTAEYDAFISYSHAWDREVAHALHRALQNFGRPWYRPRSLKLFRDETNLTARPHLWRDIEQGLRRSRWLVVMASPAAAASPWVRREIAWWLTHRSADTLLLAWTDGTLAWDPERASFDWSRTDALPREEMATAFVDEPRWVDLRWLRDPEQTRSDPRLLDSVAQFVAPLTGRSKDALIGDHVRQRRRNRHWLQATLGVLTVLLLTAVAGGVTAYQQRNHARAQTLVAQSRQLVAEASSISDTHPDLARQLMVQAYRFAPTAEAVGALVESFAMPRIVPSRGSVRTAAYSSRGLLVVADRSVRLFDARRPDPPVTLDVGKRRVTAAAFSPDGRLLALGSADGRTDLLEMTDGGRPRRAATVPGPAGGTEILTLVLTSGGRLVVMTVKGGAILDVRDPTRPRTVAGLSEASVAASPDGDLLATARADGRLWLWDLSGGGRPRQVAALTAPPGSTERTPQRAAFSPDGQTLAVAGKDSRVRLWDVTAPARPVARPELYAQSRDGLRTVAFSPDATTLAAGDGDGTIALWDVSDPPRPRPGARLTGHTATVRTLAFSPDGHTLASVGVEHTGSSALRLWSVSGTERTSAFTVLPTSGSLPPSFSADGRLLAAGGLPTTVWRVEDPRSAHLATTVETVPVTGQAAAFGPDGHTLFSGLPVKAWDLSDPANARDLTAGTIRTWGASDIAVNPELPLLAVATRVGGAVELWNVGDRERPARLARLDASAQALAFSSDGALLAAPAHEGGSVRLWKVSGHSRPTLAGEVPATDRAGATALAFVPGHRTLLLGDESGTITMWDVSDPGRPVRRGASTRHTGAVSGASFHPGGELAATSGQDGRIRLWNVADPRRPVEVTSLSNGGFYPAAAVSFSPDGRLLAAGGDRGLRLWTVDPAGIVRRLCAESAGISRDEWAEYLPDRPYDPPCA
ncbi:TIR domain-containing protein [Streptomyces sp. NPDC047725]|uniref:TIR domain-containing protein n=1 Tax=Streptomyces sp. NPDC047725 TaxID=3365487 RepID=UPI0037165C21